MKLRKWNSYLAKKNHWWYMHTATYMAFGKQTLNKAGHGYGRQEV
jgi:hypothetical protein